jgi:hypothetical protein
MGDAMEYEFAPNAHGAHVAEIEDPDHIARLLAIPEGFRLYAGGTPGKAPKALDPAVAAAFEIPTNDAGVVDYDALLEDDNLARRAYAKVFGRAPNARARTDTIVKHIRAHLTPPELPPETDPVVPDDGQAAILSGAEQAETEDNDTASESPPGGADQAEAAG